MAHETETDQKATPALSEYLPSQSNFIVAPQLSYQSDRRKDNTPRWKKYTQIAAVLIAFGLLILNFYQLRAPQEAATAATKSADLQKHILEGTEHAVFRINEITPNGDYWRLHLGNFGKLTAPTLQVSYSVIHAFFPSQKTIGAIEKGSFNRAEVMPRLETGENDVLYDFRAPGSSERMSQLTNAEETFRIEMSVTYDNGFDRLVSDEFCWQTYPFGGPPPKTVEWQSCDAAEVILFRVVHQQH